MTPEKAKAVAEFLTTNLALEYQTTCRVLAALPDSKQDWQPHEKGMKAGELAWHIATADCFFLSSVASGEFAPPAKLEQPPTTAGIVEFYQKNYPAALERCKNLSGDELTKQMNFRDVFVYPAVVFLGLAENHSIHHRGQLSTYLRSMGEKVPKIYGRSADEQ